MADAGIRFDPARPMPWPNLMHVASAGRSNVGKSTLLNKLMGTRLARVSRTPGRTRAIYMHPWGSRDHVHPELILADLPGFGHARVGHELRALWQQWAVSYFAPGGPVGAAILCVDAKSPPQPVDTDFIAWLNESSVQQLLLVGTKVDRLNQRERFGAERHLRQLQRQTALPLEADIAMISAETGEGLPQIELWLHRQGVRT